MDDMILIGDLPQGLQEEVIQRLAMHTIAFVSGSMDEGVGLLGSGVLVSANGVRAILTAQHVLQVLPQSGRFGVFLDRTNHLHTIDRQGVAFVDIARGPQEHLGPDLGVIILAPSIAGAIASKKSFYDLDSRRGQLLSSAPDLRDGAWFANGFLAERNRVTRDPDVKWLYYFSGLGGPEAAPEIDGYDFFEFPFDEDEAQDLPMSWGGMSGGGLWQIPLKREGTDVVPLSPLLSGILFYQWPSTADRCGVRAHGRKSVYQKAFGVISSHGDNRDRPGAPA